MSGATNVPKVPAPPEVPWDLIGLAVCAGALVGFLVSLVLL